MSAPTPPRPARIAELLACGDPGSLDAEVRSLLGLEAGPTALYAAGVAECATHAAWEGGGEPGGYSAWLETLPEPFLHAVLVFAADAALDGERALRTISACRATLQAVADQIGH
ncbi:hypothetical protein OG455_27790 [Kitasatospora sp. NBC_01287]|uniref:hypothetical protein n=1 Tax=Kitasatospora sp. NBC_01287 TaxID=2903573 RepID=UPI0022520CEF|nr:hypothetical protein [Kitasatospora sp. NBC_01287]MCX4749264.1 hypothetical protein [Kitasatospora sp. NBC_01287]